MNRVVPFISRPRRNSDCGSRKNLAADRPSSVWSNGPGVGRPSLRSVPALALAAALHAAVGSLVIWGWTRAPDPLGREDAIAVSIISEANIVSIASGASTKPETDAPIDEEPEPSPDMPEQPKKPIVEADSTAPEPIVPPENRDDATAIAPPPLSPRTKDKPTPPPLPSRTKNKPKPPPIPVERTTSTRAVIPSNATGGMSAEVRTQSTAIGVKRGDDHRTADYLARLAAAIRKRLFYPPAALRRGLEGKVLARLRLGPAGDALNCDIAKSSGHALLDRAALNLIRLAQPYDPPPLAQGARELTIVIPILYDLKNR